MQVPQTKLLNQNGSKDTLAAERSGRSRSNAQVKAVALMALSKDNSLESMQELS